MRFEQACRFRAEGGYRVVSKSSGVTGADERVLELFSDAMNPLFNDTTQHVLTCLGKDGRVVLALSTMGSDAHARRALFTHAVFDAAQDFAEDPATGSAVSTTHPSLWTPLSAHRGSRCR